MINNKLTSVMIYLTKYHRVIHISSAPRHSLPQIKPVVCLHTLSIQPQLDPCISQSGERNVDHTLKPALDLLLCVFFVYFEGSIRVFSAFDTRLSFPRGEFVDVLHTFSGKMADIAEQAEFVWCLNSSEIEFVVCFF